VPGSVIVAKTFCGAVRGVFVEERIDREASLRVSERPAASLNTLLEKAFGIGLPQLSVLLASPGGRHSDACSLKDGFFLVGGEHVCLLQVPYLRCAALMHQAGSSAFSKR
jgi:hypothetical protein